MKQANSSFEKLFKEHFQPLAGFAFKYLNDLDEARSLVHDVFIIFWEKFDQLEANSNHKSYLYTAVRNRCLNAIRDRKKIVPIDTAENAHFTENRSLEASELEAEIDYAINTLPKKCKMVFEMSRKEELKYSEIASKMDISVKTVEAQMSKALKLLRMHLAEFLSLLFFLWKA